MRVFSSSVAFVTLSTEMNESAVMTWPLPLPKTPDADDFFRLPPERPKRPNPFGDD